MILVTGANGMTASHLLDVYQENELFRTDLVESPSIHRMDIRDKEDVMRTVSKVRPSLVLHLAAETDVDRCEQEPDHAYRSNLIGTLNVTLACKQFDIDLVYVSTAGLFDGMKNEPYTEFDPPGPVNIYARSKLEGEKIVQTLHPRHYVVRAGWMFGGRQRDKKFVGKVAARCIEGGDKAEIKAVDDKFGSPTYAKDLLATVQRLSGSGLYGLYHTVNTGSASRYDVAVEIARFLETGSRVTRSTSDSFVLPAPRPRSEVARNYKLELVGLNHMQCWQNALCDYLASWIPSADKMRTVSA
jgi:dTDP-4-dehydrorhamnose reductase